MRLIPASISQKELSKEAEPAVIILLCKANAAGDKLVVESVYKGKREYEVIKSRIAEFLPSRDKDALATKGYRELVFIRKRNELNGAQTIKSFAIWPQRDEIVGGEKLRFLSLDLEDVELAVSNTNKSEKSKDD